MSTYDLSAIYEFENKLDDVILLSSLFKEYGKIVEAEGSSKEGLQVFVNTLVDRFISSIDFDFIRQVVGNVKIKIPMERLSIKIEEDLDYKLIFSYIQLIYDRVNITQRDIQYCKEVIRFLTKAKNYINSFKKAVKEFICSPLVAGEYFKSNSDRLRFINPVLVDFDSYINLIKNLVMDVNLFMGELSSNLNLMLRFESSLRLMTKHKEMDYIFNVKQSNTNNGFRIEND